MAIGDNHSQLCGCTFGQGWTVDYTLSVQVVPEPGALWLLLGPVAALIYGNRRSYILMSRQANG